jgi:hypothetical protein
MQDSNLPSQKFTVIWAASALAADVTAPFPSAAQPSGLASLSTGFTETNFTPVASGGVPPWGKDFNGIFQLNTAWLQWYQAGGPIAYDAAYSAAIGGYPKGAIITSATTDGVRWRSTADNNVTNPDASGAGWVPYPYATPFAISLGGTNNAGPFTQGSVIFSDGAKLTQDNASLYWFDSMRRLGIGTNAPNANLDVRGTVLATDSIETTSGSVSALFAPNGGLNVGGSGLFGGGVNAVGIVETNSGAPTALFAPFGGVQVGGSAQIGGVCNAAGGIWTGNLDIISNVLGTGIGVINSTGPVYELQLGPGGNTWVISMDPATSDWTLSFNTLGKAKLDQFGNLTIQGTYSPSDIALKQNVHELEPTLDRLSRVRPVSFEYRDQPGERKLGVIAQELQAEFPELVRAGPDGTLAVAYDKLTAVLLGAVRELSAEVAALRAAR